MAMLHSSETMVELISLLSGFNTVADSCECVHWQGFNNFIVFARCISEDNDAIVLGVLNEKCLIFSGTNLRLECEFGSELHLLVEGVFHLFCIQIEPEIQQGLAGGCG